MEFTKCQVISHNKQFTLTPKRCFRPDLRKIVSHTKYTKVYIVLLKAFRVEYLLEVSQFSCLQIREICRMRAQALLSLSLSSLIFQLENLLTTFLNSKRANRFALQPLRKCICEMRRYKCTGGEHSTMWTHFT